MEIGKVEPKKILFKESLNLECGRVLTSFEMIYETYGKLNAKKDNAILICHALSGNHHAAGLNKAERPGWWNSLIGPEKAIDTNKFFIVSPNNLGGCHGTTGPASLNPETNKPFGPDFPVITVLDWVNSQLKLADYLGIDSWHAVVGGSLGGMQALQWSITYPQRIKKAVVIAAAPKLSAQNIAFNELSRQAIMADPNWKDGSYSKLNLSPDKGLAVARMAAHITYLSQKGLQEKFGRKLQERDDLKFGFDADFQIESYLRHQGSAFVDRFDANSYLYITRAMDYFDLIKQYNGNLSDAFKESKTKFFIISFTSDWLYPTSENKEIVIALNAAGADVGFIEITSDKGHDSFLLDVPDFLKSVKNFLEANY